MERQTEIIEKIKELTKEYFSLSRKGEFIPGVTRIPLNVPSYGWEEAMEAYESILTTWVTMGKKVKQFESMFADYVDVSHAAMVNSGSSFMNHSIFFSSFGGSILLLYDLFISHS